MIIISILNSFNTIVDNHTNNSNNNDNNDKDEENKTNIKQNSNTCCKGN